jgi:hypothetical protein
MEKEINEIFDDENINLDKAQRTIMMERIIS